MDQETREYLELVVSTITHKHRRRGHTTGKKRWEIKLVEGAKKLLREQQSDLKLTSEP